jgi:hypothetical protein
VRFGASRHRAVASSSGQEALALRRAARDTGAEVIVMRPSRTRRYAALLALPLALAALAVPAQAEGPPHVMGRVVDSQTGLPVSDATVKVWNELVGSEGEELQGTATTNSGGRFRVARVTGEEHGIEVLGPAGYESGWLDCDGTVVPTWLDACSHSLGNLGLILLDPFEPDLLPDL